MTDPNQPPDRYALVGHPVDHSRSPMIHTLFAQQTGENLTYELIDALPEQFATAVLGFSAAGGRGMNITVPYKEAAFDLCKTHGKEARAAGAVNTITFRPAGIHGDNTDGTGLIKDLCVNLDREIAAKRLLILGAGGAARGIVGPILAREPAILMIANRTVARAESLRRFFGSPEALSICGFDELADGGEFDIIINATSAGLKGDQPPFPPGLVKRKTFCYDLAYSLGTTPFVAWAMANGAGHAVQGWGMLIEQAADSFQIWRGQRPDTKPILEAVTGISAS